jgi:hypothetical protein
MLRHSVLLSKLKKHYFHDLLLPFLNFITFPPFFLKLVLHFFYRLLILYREICYLSFANIFRLNILI